LLQGNIEKKKELKKEIIKGTILIGGQKDK
jgi:hypothetical protein